MNFEMGLEKGMRQPGHKGRTSRTRDQCTTCLGSCSRLETIRTSPQLGVCIVLVLKPRRHKSNRQTRSKKVKSFFPNLSLQILHSRCRARHQDTKIAKAVGRGCLGWCLARRENRCSAALSFSPWRLEMVCDWGWLAKPCCL